MLKCPFIWQMRFHKDSLGAKWSFAYIDEEKYSNSFLYRICSDVLFLNTVYFIF